jgi:diacylglycerol kinase family enzyme
VRLLVLSNPKSRRNRRNPALIERLRALLRPLGERARLLVPASPEELRHAVAEAKDHGTELLALNGGDGTNHVTLTAFLRAWGEDALPAVALLRGGTMNTVARGLGIRSGNPSTLLEKLLRRLERGERPAGDERSLLRIETQEEGAQYGFIFGNGLTASFLDVYYEYSEPSPWVAAKVTARAVGAALFGGPLRKRLFDPVDVDVTLDGQPVEQRRYLAWGCATVPEIGLSLKPWYRAGERPGTFHALGLPPRALPIVRALPRIWRGLPSDLPDCVDALASELRIESERPLGWIVDGDYHRPAQSVRVSAGPRLRIVRP